MNEGKGPAGGTLAGKTLFITGASRGIGLAIALRAARDGANIAVAAKTAEPHAKLQGTIHSAAEAIEKAGGKALPLVVDVRDEASVQKAVAAAVDRFGGIDICINNASAIHVSPTLETEMKRYDLIHQVNTRGAFLVSKTCLPHLLKAANPHILMISPPLDMDGRWFAPSLAYTMSKFGMSMCVLGLSAEFAEAGVAVNALWPRTIIGTAAIEFGHGASGAERMPNARRPEIMADAAYALLTRPSRRTTGQFLLDDTVLQEEGVTDFAQYQVDPAQPLRIDLFVPETAPPPPPGVIIVER
jgi:citronellol/citronellal dehydrogenase